MADSPSVLITPRRLAKPRTIKSSSNIFNEQPTTPSSPQNSFDQDYFGRDAVVVNSQGERRSRSKSRSKIKAYLYGSSHDVAQTSSDDEETQTGIAGAARDVRKRLSYTGSFITPLQSAKASATRLSTSSSSGLLSTRSTESQGPESEESAMIADQIKHKAYHDSLAAQNHVSTPVDEDKHVDSVMAPLRRKSLYTPGIATRNVSDILRKPPKPSTDHDYYYDPSRPENSPLSHLASLNVGEDGRSTPCNLHYPQLGGLRLGTLRVTNGASSPVPGNNHPPDLEHRSVTPESKIHDEYYTASEGSVISDGAHATPLPPRGGSPLKYGSRMEDSMRTGNRVPSSPDRSLSFERESSDESFPFARERVDQAARFERRAPNHLLHFRTATPSGIRRSEARSSNESSSNMRNSSKPCHVEATEPQNLLTYEKQSPNKSLTFENELRDEIEDPEVEKSKESFTLKTGPPKSYRVNGPTLDESFLSRSETFHDGMYFEGEPLGESFPSNTRTFKSHSVEGRRPDEWVRFGEKSPIGASDIADQYIAELDGSPFIHSSLERKRNIMTQSHDSTTKIWRSLLDDAEVRHAGNGSVSREDAFRRLTVNCDLPFVVKPERLSVPSPQPSRHSASSGMPTTDSGYCSYASLAGAPTEEACFEIKGSPIPSDKVTASAPPQALETVRSSARTSFQVPIRKLKKQRPNSQPPPVNLITGYHELIDADIPRVPSVIALRHANRLSQFPLLEHTFPSSQHTSANGPMSPVQAHDAPIRFPSPANALEAASAPFESFPTASLKARDSTIVVGEDDSRISDLVRSPSWSEFGGGRRRKEQKRLVKEEKGIEKRLLREEKELEKRLHKGRKDLEKQIRQDENKQRSTRSRSASRTRARSSEGQSRHETLATIADFGTVTESLGSSPYDIATSAFPNPQITRNWHPHQISTAVPRPKPSIGARTRSHTMFLDMPSVPALAAVDLKANNVEWARNRQRSQTSLAASADFFNDRGGIPGKVVRPVTMEVLPPVPALPPANKVKRLEAEIIRSRPHSMIVEAPVSISTSRQFEGQTKMPYPSESGQIATPRKVPDLWSNGSLERKSPKTVEGFRQASNTVIRENNMAMPTKNNLWETESNAWSQRRKSAGEALLRNQVRDVVFDHHIGQEDANPTPSWEQKDRPTPLTRSFTSGAYQTFEPTPTHLGPFPNPLASHPWLTTQQPTSALNTQDVNNQATSQRTQRHSFNPLASPSRPSMSSYRHENQPPTSTPSRARTQSFQIPRKRVGSGPSIIRAEAAITSRRYEGILV